MNKQLMTQKMEPMSYDARQKIANDEEYIMHIGVKGMRWGVRRRKVKIESPKSRNYQPESRPRRMSNKELKARVTRMKMESEMRKYLKELEPPKPATKSRIEKLVGAAGTIATMSTHATTIYKNLDALGLIGSKKGN